MFERPSVHTITYEPGEPSPAKAIADSKPGPKAVHPEGTRQATLCSKFFLVTEMGQVIYV